MGIIVFYSPQEPTFGRCLNQKCAASEKKVDRFYPLALVDNGWNLTIAGSRVVYRGFKSCIPRVQELHGGVHVYHRSYHTRYIGKIRYPVRLCDCTFNSSKSLQKASTKYFPAFWIPRVSAKHSKQFSPGIETQQAYMHVCFRLASQCYCVATLCAAPARLSPPCLHSTRTWNKPTFQRARPSTPDMWTRAQPHILPVGIAARTLFFLTFEAVNRGVSTRATFGGVSYSKRASHQQIWPRPSTPFTQTDVARNPFITWLLVTIVDDIRR